MFLVSSILYFLIEMITWSRCFQRRPGRQITKRGKLKFLENRLYAIWATQKLQTLMMLQITCFVHFKDFFHRIVFTPSLQTI